jgi:hypothetical protein
VALAGEGKNYFKNSLKKRSLKKMNLLPFPH